MVPQAHPDPLNGWVTVVLLVLAVSALVWSIWSSFKKD